MSIHCFMKNVLNFFLYTGTSEVYNLRLIRKSNIRQLNQRKRIPQMPLQIQCILYKKYRKLGLYERSDHVPTRNYIPIYSTDRPNPTPE